MPAAQPTAAAQREAEKDQTIADMKDRLAQLEALLDQKTAPTVPVVNADDEVEQLRAELDANGITYDKRWAAPKLRAALQGQEAA